MEYIIRECTEYDVEALCKLNINEMGYDLSAEETSKQLKRILQKDTDKIYVAVAGNTVVGYIHANDYDLLYYPHMKNIMGIAVASEYNGNGIGKALIKKVEEWALQTGAVGLRLVSGAERNGAHEFYKRCGFSDGKQQLNFKKML